VPRIEIKHIHRVRAKLSGGRIREYHYAWRGGPKFWSSDSDVLVNSSEYVALVALAVDVPRTKQRSTPAMVDAYLNSVEYKSKKPRTQADYRKWALRFAGEFTADAAAMFEAPGARGEINTWRQKWSHSPKQFDYAGTVVGVILNWARDSGWVTHHHFDKIRRVYKANRSEIIWRQSDVATFLAVAPDWVGRILVTACCTGLRPGDLIKLHRRHLHKTCHGRRIEIPTNKRGTKAYIPITAELGRICVQTCSPCAGNTGCHTCHRRVLEGLASSFHIYQVKGILGGLRSRWSD
jgi:hypothetical protein